MTTGRPSKYNPDDLEHIHRLCLMGCTDEGLADFLDVSRRTIATWKKKYPEFLYTVRGGKQVADANVAFALYEKAIGGDTTAMMFWMKNRQPEQWRDQSHIKVEDEMKEQLKQAAIELDEKIDAILRDTDSDPAKKPH